MSAWYGPHQVGTHRSEYKSFLRTFWDAQTQTFENNGQGWIFWTWKAPK
jgi:glucan 1,3-beta-glucosidase